jgi:thiol-disulfide isomerase/thioredoxin
MWCRLSGRRVPGVKNNHKLAKVFDLQTFTYFHVGVVCYRSAIYLSRMKVFLTVLFVASGLFVSYTNAQSDHSNQIHYITDATVDFDGLIKKFKGKVIYVDMWATWCRPCRQELKQTKDIANFQRFAVKNDIVILYICLDRDGNNWKSFISRNDLFGYHVLVNRRLDDDLHTKFAVFQLRRGKIKKGFYIPRHLIIDRNGFVADSSVSGQGSSAVYSELAKLLR